MHRSPPKLSIVIQDPMCSATNKRKHGHSGSDDFNTFSIKAPPSSKLQYYH